MTPIPNCLTVGNICFSRPSSLKNINSFFRMLSQPISVTFDIGGGRMVTIETAKLARQADGAVTVRQGNCILLATVVANKEPKEGQDFFPLSVDYQEKFASAGRIPGSFFKRAGMISI